MAINNNNKNVTDKFGRTGIVEPTFAFNTTTEGVELTVNGGSPNGATTSLILNDFWRKSSVSGTTLPTAINSFTVKPNNINDTTSFIQRGADIFIGGANGLVRAGNGNGNILTNTVFGQFSMGSNTGSQNSAFGYAALNSNTSGSLNTAVGREALTKNTSGSESVAVGAGALFTNTTGTGNISVGVSALYFNTIGQNNTAMGRYALNANTTGGQNTALGRQSLYRNTTGSGNLALGNNALYNLTTGSENIVLSGSSNTNVTGTGAALTTGSENIAIGGNGLTIGGFNLPPLSGALSANASRNTLIGTASSAFLQGNENVIIGFGSGDIGVGTKNVLLGSYTFGPNTGSGWPTAANIATNNNTFIGSDYNRSNLAQVAIGDNNTALGFNINQRIVGITNATALGANTASTKSNQISMGNSAVTEVLLSGKLAIDINALSAAADGTPIVIRTVGGVKTITI